MFFYRELDQAAEPPIVSNGLVLSLDAQDTNSYPGTGTSWYDLVTANQPAKPALSFDGDGDYLQVQSNTNLEFGTGDFTIELWLYFKSRGNNGSSLVSNYTSWGAGALGIFAGHGSANSNKYQVSCNGTFPAIQSTNDIIYNQWHHIALVRQSGTMTLYINGVNNGSTSANVTLNGTGLWTIGTAGDAISNYFMNGYIDDLRVTKGVVRYTSNFTPPTTIEHTTDPNKSNVSLLLQAKSATIQDYSDNAFPITVAGDAKYITNANQNSATLKNGPSFINTNPKTFSFDGVNDFADFSIPTSIPTSGTVSVEIWAKVNSFGTPEMMFGWSRYDVFSNNGKIGYNTGNSDIFGLSATQVVNLNLAGNWIHYVFEMRSDVPYTNNKIYINGASQVLSQLDGSEDSTYRNFNGGAGRIASWRNSDSYFKKMDCAVFRVYNRSLTQSEIDQNYNALKSRYIP